MMQGATVIGSLEDDGATVELPFRRVSAAIRVGESKLQVATGALTQGRLDDPLLGVGDIRSEVMGVWARGIGSWAGWRPIRAGSGTVLGRLTADIGGPEAVGVVTSDLATQPRACGRGPGTGQGYRKQGTAPNRKNGCIDPLN